MILQDFDGCHQGLSQCHIAMTMSDRELVIAKFDYVCKTAHEDDFSLDYNLN